MDSEMTDINMEDITSDSKKEDVPKKKRRVLKKVLKKDKAKGFKPKRNLNTSLSSLSKSFNRSVTSMVIKQTLQSNNRQLAMTLEKTRKDLRIAHSVIMDQKQEIIDLQTQINTYKYMTGLKPEDVENEVKNRMEKYISDLKMHLGKMGQQLFDATTSLGEAMDLCMNVSRRSVGSCRTSTISTMSDDDGDSHYGTSVGPDLFHTEVLNSDPNTKNLPQRIARMDTEVLLSDPSTRNLPQRVARLDMSVITEQSILLDDIEQPEEMALPVIEGLVEEEIEDDMPNKEEKTVSKPKDKVRSKRRSGKKESEKEDIESEKGDYCKKTKNQISDSSEKVQQEGNSFEEIHVKAVTDGEKMGNLSKKDRRGTFVLPDSKQKDQHDIEKEFDKAEVINEECKNIESQKSDTCSRSKKRRETFVLNDNIMQKRESSDQISEKKHSPEKNIKNRRGTFVVPDLPADDTPVQPKDRRETYVLPQKSVIQSKSHDHIATKNEKSAPVSSKSDGDLNSKEDKRKTFLVPSSKDEFLLPPLPTQQKKASPTKFDDTEVTKYFNSDMDFTEVIDTTNGIIVNNKDTDQNIKTVNQKSKESKSSAKEMKKVSTSSKNRSKSDTASKKERAESSTSDVKQITGQMGAVGKNISHFGDKKSEESHLAVEFRLPKPGKIVFAASRKTFDGKREPVPTKLPQRSRSKTKVKLTKSVSDDSNVKSIFDFHEKTPTVLKQASSVYDLSMNESIQGQKESYSSFRDKLSKQSNIDENQTTKENENNVNNEKTTKGKPNLEKQANEKGEIIYHLPLKGCSPDIPEKISRERSQSRGRSRSRGKRITVTDDDKVDSESEEKLSSRTRSKSRGRTSSKDSDIKENDDAQLDDSIQSTLNRSRSRGRSRTRKNDKSVGENGDLEEKISERKRRSRSKGREKNADEIISDTADKIIHETDSSTTRSRSRGRSRSRKIDRLENDTDVQAPVKDKSLDDDTKTRSRSRGRSKTRKQDNLKSDDVSPRRVTRSKSRGRSRSQKEEDVLSTDEVSEKNSTRSKSRRHTSSKALQTLLVSLNSSSDENIGDDKSKNENIGDDKSKNENIKVDSRILKDDEASHKHLSDKDENELKTKKMLSSKATRSRSTASTLVEDSDDESKKDNSEEAKSVTRTARSRTISSRLNTDSDNMDNELSDEEYFKLPKKISRKSKTVDLSSEEEDVHPLDKLFKNAKKKSLPDVFNANSDSLDNLSNQNILLGDSVPLQSKDTSFHEICETPLKPRENMPNKSKEQDRINVDSCNTEKDKEENCFEQFEIDLNCVARRGRSRSKKVDKNSIDFIQTEHENMLENLQTTEETDIEKAKCLTLEDKNTKKDNDLLTSTDVKERKGKRRHDSSSDTGNSTKKSKKTNKEEKENTRTSSSLSLLKRKLASLGTNLKPETSAESDESVTENNTNKHKDSPPSNANRMSQGKEVFTPTVENVIEEPRSRRRAANVCYKEMSLNFKLRREDVLGGKKPI